MLQGPSGQDIRSATFPHEKRRGFQAEAVRRYLAGIADHVDALQGQLDAHAHSEHSAMLLLQQARQTAEQTIAEATDQADAMRAAALAESRETIESSRAEARQRTAGAEAQIEAAFAEASTRLNEVEREIQARRRELAMLEAASARFAADQATRMREQADVLLGAANSISSAAAPGAVDAHLVPEDVEEAVTIDLTAAAQEGATGAVGVPPADVPVADGPEVGDGPDGPDGSAGSVRTTEAGPDDPGLGHDVAPRAEGAAGGSWAWDQRVGTNGLFTT